MQNIKWGISRILLLRDFRVISFKCTRFIFRSSVCTRNFTTKKIQPFETFWVSLERFLLFFLEQIKVSFLAVPFYFIELFQKSVLSKFAEEVDFFSSSKLRFSKVEVLFQPIFPWLSGPSVRFKRYCLNWFSTLK